MARPTKDGLDYFPHDTDTYMDDKIESLEAVYGNDGYAAYFKLLERIYRNAGNILISDAETMQKYAKRCNINNLQMFEEMLNFMAKIGLFDEKLWKDEKSLSSNGIRKRVQVVVDKRERMKDRYKKKVSAVETIAETQQSKVKKSKVKKSIPPQEVIDLEGEIQNFKKVLKWDNQRIKQNFLERGLPESQIDEALGKKF